MPGLPAHLLINTWVSEYSKFFWIKHRWWISRPDPSCFRSDNVRSILGCLGFKVLLGIPQDPPAGRAPGSWKHRLHPVLIGKASSLFSAFPQLRNAKNYLESLASSTLVEWGMCLSHPAETRLLPFDPAAECPEPLFEGKSVGIASL